MYGDMWVWLNAVHGVCVDVAVDVVNERVWTEGRMRCASPLLCTRDCLDLIV